MIIEEKDKVRMLTSWSREVELFLTERGLYRCPCGSTVQITVGQKDRTRCKGCKTMVVLEL